MDANTIFIFSDYHLHNHLYLSHELEQITENLKYHVLSTEKKRVSSQDLLVFDTSFPWLQRF